MKPNNPKITVITVTYNLINAGRENNFRQCIESVQNQTYKNIEHIIIDGASNDGTLDLIKEYADKNLIKYISENDSGIYDAMNKGIKIAEGKYIAFLNSDDFWHDPKGVEESINVLEESGADFCGGNTIFLDEQNPRKNHIHYADLNKIFTRMPFCHQSMFCKKTVMVEEGMFDISFKSAGDYDFLVRLYLKGYKGAVVPSTFATFRIGGESFVNYEVSHKECKRILHKYFDKYYKISEKEFAIWLQKPQLPTALSDKLEKFLYKPNQCNYPKVSIITVCYNLVKANRVESFKKCLDSVYNQTYKNIEHIIIDGASTDGTVDIIKEYADKGWVKYISEKDNGIYFAMKKGEEIATGEFCYFLNTDDLFYDNNVVADVVKVFEETKTDAVIGDLYPYVLDENVPYVKVFEINHIAKFDDMVSKAAILNRNIHHQTIFYNRKIFKDSSFFSETIPDGSDWLLHCEAFLKNNYTFQYTPRTITKFNMGGVSTQDTGTIIEECCKLQQKMIDEFVKYIEPEAQTFFGYNGAKIPIIKNIMLFKRIPLLKIKKTDSEKNVYLFNLIKILKIKKKASKRKVYLFGYLPICSLHKKRPIEIKLIDLMKEKSELIEIIKKLKLTHEMLEQDKQTLLIELEHNKNYILHNEYRKSFSQAGEDKLIDFILFYYTNTNRKELSYIDIGSNYPIDSNNTYYFYCRNARGVLVEPNSELCEISKKERPEDIVINAGIKFNELNESTYYRFSDCGLNTFEAGRVSTITAKGHELLEQSKIELVSINSIFETYFKNKKVDVFSLDVEGVDFDILKSIDFSLYRPKVFCIESNKKSFEFGAKNEVVDFMESKGYMLMADTSINFIFLAKEDYIKDKYC